MDTKWKNIQIYIQYHNNIIVANYIWLKLQLNISLEATYDMES